MLGNRKGLIFGLFVVGVSPVAMGQMMTITEATLKQSDIARVELDAKLEEAKKKITGMSGNSLAPVAPVVPAYSEKPADEVLSLISVYGVGHKLKADFIFRGAVITLEPGGVTKAAGWGVEKLTATEAVLTKHAGKQVVKRNTVYLSAVSASNPQPMPPPPMPPAGVMGGPIVPGPMAVVAPAQPDTPALPPAVVTARPGVPPVAVASTQPATSAAVR